MAPDLTPQGAVAALGAESTRSDLEKAAQRDYEEALAKIALIPEGPLEAATRESEAAFVEAQQKIASMPEDLSRSSTETIGGLSTVEEECSVESKKSDKKSG